MKKMILAALCLLPMVAGANNGFNHRGADYDLNQAEIDAIRGNMGSGSADATIELSGTIADLRGVVVADTNGQFIASHNGSLEESQNFTGQLVEVNNVPGGYNLVITSENSGRLVHETYASNSVGYRFFYDAPGNERTSDLADGLVRTNGGSRRTTVDRAEVGVRDYQITTEAQNPSLLLSGTYTDTLTFSIESRN